MTTAATQPHHRENDFAEEHHVYEPHLVGLPPLVPYLREAWRRRAFAFELSRTKLRAQKLVPGSDEGGSPAGFFTGATGVTAYRGHAWPEEYKNQLFVAEHQVQRRRGGLGGHRFPSSRTPTVGRDPAPRSTAAASRDWKRRCACRNVVVIRLPFGAAGPQPHMAHPEGQRERPVEAPATGVTRPSRADDHGANSDPRTRGR